MALARAQTKSEWLVTIQGIQLFALTFSGVDDQAPTSQISDGFHQRGTTKVGAPVLNALTFTFADDPRQNQPLIDFWKSRGGNSQSGEGGTVTAQAVEYDVDTPVPVGTPIQLNDFRPTRLQMADADKTSADASVVTLTGVAASWQKGAQI